MGNDQSTPSDTTSDQIQEKLKNPFDIDSRIYQKLVAKYGPAYISSTDYQQRFSSHQPPPPSSANQDIDTLVGIEAQRLKKTPNELIQSLRFSILIEDQEYFANLLHYCVAQWSHDVITVFQSQCIPQQEEQGGGGAVKDDTGEVVPFADMEKLVLDDRVALLDDLVKKYGFTEKHLQSPSAAEKDAGDGQHRRLLQTSALHLACHINISKNPQLRFDVNNTTKKRHFPVETLSSNIVEWLIANGAEVNALDGRGESPLITAASCGLVNACKELLARGAKISETACERNGQGNILHTIVMCDAPQSIIPLLEAVKPFTKRQDRQKMQLVSQDPMAYDAPKYTPLGRAITRRTQRVDEKTKQALPNEALIMDSAIFYMLQNGFNFTEHYYEYFSDPQMFCLSDKPHKTSALYLMWTANYNPETAVIRHLFPVTKTLPLEDLSDPTFNDACFAAIPDVYKNKAMLEKISQQNILAACIIHGMFGFFQYLVTVGGSGVLKTQIKDEEDGTLLTTPIHLLYAASSCVMRYSRGTPTKKVLSPKENQVAYELQTFARDHDALISKWTTDVIKNASADDDDDDDAPFREFMLSLDHCFDGAGKTPLQLLDVVKMKENRPALVVDDDL